MAEKVRRSGSPSRILSFPPVCDKDATMLILGSMPGRASLQAQQYYAHPQNAFWRILGHLLGFPSDLPYPQRLEQLTSRGIALWDVLHSCTRHSSLDSDIEETSIIPNAIAQLLSEHAGIRRIYFNGSKAEQAFRRHVAPALSARGTELICLRLPSTSPAHASRSFQDKVEAWRIVVRDLP